jgi:vacuolar protein sorting-associated protein 13A/C
MLEGGKALAKGFLSGAVGILAKPVEGMERGGVTGLLEGMTKVRVELLVSQPSASVLRNQALLMLARTFACVA